MSGAIDVHPEVFKSIVAKCALDIPGVCCLSGGGTVVQSLMSWGSQTETRGVNVENNQEERTSRIEVHVVVEKGHPVPTAAENLQKHIKEMVEKMTGYEVVGVDVYIDDIRDRFPVPSEKPMEQPSENRETA